MSVTAASDVVEIPDPEVEAYASVGASISPSVLGIGPSTSLGLGQTTHTTPGISVGLATAPVASGVTPGSLEFERSTKKRIGPSTRFYVHNFGRLGARFDSAGGRRPPRPHILV